MFWSSIRPLFIAAIIFFEYCHAKFDLRQHLSTKSPYVFFPNELTSPPATCEPVQLNLVARHGSRNPSASDIENMSNFQDLLSHPDVQTALAGTEFDWMRHWSNPFDVSTKGLLADAGIQEHYQLGKRLLENYPSLFPPNRRYIPPEYLFSSTQVSRTSQSAQSLAYGIFEDTGSADLGPTHFQPIAITTETISNDQTLYFHKACQSYVDHLEKDDEEIKKEETEWGIHEIDRISRAFTERLGLSSVLELEISDVDLIYKICGFEVSLHNDTSHFCTLFEEDELEALEYYHDLGEYWKKSYGFNLNWKIAAHLLAAVTDQMEGFVNGSFVDAGELAPVTSMRFAHAETIQPFLSILELFEDPEPLRHDLPDEVIANRKWRTSLISNFAANVLFVLYACEKGEFKVKLLVNEQEVPIPGNCEDVIYCSFDRFLDRYDDIFNEDFDQICNGFVHNDNESSSCAWQSIGFLVSGVLVVILGVLYFRSRSSHGRATRKISTDVGMRRSFPVQGNATEYMKLNGGGT